MLLALAAQALRVKGLRDYQPPGLTWEEWVEGLRPKPAARRERDLDARRAEIIAFAAKAGGEVS